KVSLMPVRRQRSRKFVQQPIATCGERSTSCCALVSWYDPARPPSAGACSNNSTSAPRSTAATAAASPATPPPMTATVGLEVVGDEETEDINKFLEPRITRITRIRN